MNWRRGLFRFWLVVSLIWIGLVGWYTYETDIAQRQWAAKAAECAQHRSKNSGLGNPFDCYDGNVRGMFADLIPLEQILMRGAVVAVGPPLAVLFAGLIGGWVLAGFRRSTSPS